jgi:gluconokinase
MGVAGSGKTTIGQMLAKSLHWEFSDADAFHSQENIAKMTDGIPLTDADRTPWLLAMQRAIQEWLQNNQNVVLACSALKADYRQFLLFDEEHIKLVYLKGSFQTIQKRLEKRQNHFMNEKLLQSQFDTIEEPDNAIIIDISESPEAIVQHIIKSLRYISSS